MLGWVTQLAHVLAALAPAFAASITVAGLGLGLYELVTSIEASIVSYTHYIVDAVSGWDFIYSYLGPNSAFFNTLLIAANIPEALRVAINLVAFFVTMSVISGTIFGSLGVSLAGVYVYRKTKLACNILAARGANE